MTYDIWHHSKHASITKERKRSQKKVTKSDVVGGVTAKKSDTTYSE